MNTELNKAVKLLNSGNAPEAETVIKGVLKRFPNQPAALYLMGGALKVVGEFSKAEKYYKRSLAAAKNQPQVENALGALFLAKRQYSDAEVHLKRALKLHPKYVEAWSNLGIVQLNKREHSLAGKSFARVLETNPDFTPAIRGYARSLMAAGDYINAKVFLERAVSLAPKQVDNRFYLGRCLYQLGQFGEATEQLNIAVEMAPTSTAVRHEAAKVAMILGESEAAKNHFDEALKSNPFDLTLIRDFSRFLFFSGSDEECLKPYFQALEAGSTDPAIISGFTQDAVRVGRFGEARHLLNKFLEDHGNSYLIFAALSHLNIEEHKLVEALDAAKRAVVLASDSKAAQQQLSVSAMLNGDLKLAKKAAMKARSLDPEDQLSVAHHCTSLRLEEDLLADGLYDLERVTQRVEVSPPDNYSSMEAFNNDLIGELTSLHQLAGEPIDQSLRGGTQVQLTQLARSSSLISALGDQLISAVKTFTDKIDFVEGHPFLGRRPNKLDFSGIWSVRLNSGGSHVSHVHPEGWLSACYYVNLPEDVMDEGSHQGWLRLGAPPQSELRSKLDFLDIRPMAGSLILFPSYMWHGTVPFASTTPRLTVAFDIPSDVPAVAEFS